MMQALSSSRCVGTYVQSNCRGKPSARLTGARRRTAIRVAEVVDLKLTGKADTDATASGVNPHGAESSVPAPDVSKDAQSTFPWFSHWYPVAVVEDLDPGRPHSTYLLGIPLALWRDKQGAWHAVEDKCPHRLAPLSEGRIESDGTLQCAYHGWQFNGQGACTHIPQLRNDDKAHQVACASRRSCVRAFPTQVLHGLLWVLPDASPQAHEKFAKGGDMPNNVLKELLDGPEAQGVRQTTAWFARDMAIRYDTLCENLVDPSHVPFAHHGVQGRRENEKGTTTKVDGIALEGFDFEFDTKRPGGGVVRPLFSPPTYVRYGSPIRSLHVYAVPTRPGWSRLYATFTKDSKVPSPLPWFVEAIVRLTEGIPWIEHAFTRNAVLDGDTYMLHVQERLLDEQKGNWKEAFYMPAPADASVVALRKWFDTFAGEIPTCEPGTPLLPAMSKSEVLDRYSQHTAHCRHCKKALRNLDITTGVAAVCGLLAAAWLAARVLVGLPLLSPAAGAGLAVLLASGGLVAGLRAVRQNFFFVDYVHAEKK